MDTHLLIVNQNAPYHGGNAKEALDIALAAAAYEQDVSVLFVGDGCYQLMPGQSPDSINNKCIAQMLKVLPIYGVEMLLADAQSLDERHIEHFADELKVERVSEQDIKTLYQNATTVLRF